MIDTPQDAWIQQDLGLELRRPTTKQLKRAWRSMATSFVLVTIAWMAYIGLRWGRDEKLHVAYVWIVWLFIGRFVWTIWKYLRVRRALSTFRKGVERQLQVAGTRKDSDSILEER